jgi:hypothetical protein
MPRAFFSYGTYAHGRDASNEPIPIHCKTDEFSGVTKVHVFRTLGLLRIVAWWSSVVVE